MLHAEHFISFCNEFNKFIKARARMLDYIYHYDIKFTLESHICCKNFIILSLCT